MKNFIGFNLLSDTMLLWGGIYLCEKWREKSAKKICQLKNNAYLCIAIAKIAQLVEHNLAKVGVAGSSPVFRSKRTMKYVNL